MGLTSLCRGLLQVISSYGEKKMFYVAKFHPEQQNVMLAGCGDKKIYQWDMDSGDLVQVGTAGCMEVPNYFCRSVDVDACKGLSALVQHSCALSRQSTPARTLEGQAGRLTLQLWAGGVCTALCTCGLAEQFLGSGGWCRWGQQVSAVVHRRVMQLVAVATALTLCIHGLAWQHAAALEGARAAMPAALPCAFSRCGQGRQLCSRLT